MNLCFVLRFLLLIFLLDCLNNSQKKEDGNFHLKAFSLIYFIHSSYMMHICL